MSFEKPFAEIDENWALYAASYYFLKGVGKVALGFKVYGAENIPKEGRALLAINHRHWLELFLGPTVLPNRHVSTLVKKEAYGTPIVGKLFEKWGTIPVDRENPTIDTTREVLRRLEQERLVGIAPEGHRNQEETLGEMHRGVARWARLGNAVTVPVAIRGADSFLHAFMHRSAESIVGTAIDPPESRSDEDAFMAHLRESMQNLYDS